MSFEKQYIRARSMVHLFKVTEIKRRTIYIFF
jgi:hypothetical protein